MSQPIELTSMTSHKNVAPQALAIDSIPLTTTEAAPQVEQIPENLSKLRSVFIVITVAGITFLNTLGSGLLTVALPRIAEDLDLPVGLLLWPASVYALTSGCTLLLVGAIADVLGNRPVFLTGCALLTAFTLGVSLAKSGIQLIMFRACQGIAMSFCLPTAVGLISKTFPHGRTRNIAFASLGGGSPIGFALGLVVGGLFVDSVGWRYGYYMACIFNGLIFVAAAFTLPGQGVQENRKQRLMHDIDWIGAILASTCLALLSYVFAGVTSSYLRIKNPANIALLSVSVMLMPCFVLWVGRQERLGKPAIIPNSLWKKAEFTSICITVFLTWAGFNAFGYFVTLLFQVIEKESAIQASLHFLPLVIMGVATNVVVGLLVSKVSAMILVPASIALAAVSPLLFAILSPSWSYWRAAFPAMCLSPIASDLLFITSNLVITNAFPDSTQALAGGVFNTVSQLGNSIGLAATAMLAAGITDSAKNAGADRSSALLEGYRSAFWMCFAAGVVSCVVSFAGLRKSGKIGLKRE